MPVVFFGVFSLLASRAEYTVAAVKHVPGYESALVAYGQWKIWRNCGSGEVFSLYQQNAQGAGLSSISRFSGWHHKAPYIFQPNVF